MTWHTNRPSSHRNYPAFFFSILCYFQRVFRGFSHRIKRDPTLTETARWMVRLCCQSDIEFAAWLATTLTKITLKVFCITTTLKQVHRSAVFICSNYFLRRILISELNFPLISSHFFCWSKDKYSPQYFKSVWVLFQDHKKKLPRR